MRLTLFQRHRAKWDGCTDCDLHVSRDRMCFYRGVLPCDVLFVGQAPGKSENASGLPFDGPAGQLLDKIVAQAFHGETLRLAFTNLVCCMPWDEETQKDIEPLPYEIKTCRPRLIEFINLAGPRMIVAVGNLAKNYLPTLTEGIRVVHIVHPSFILTRLTVVQRPNAIRKAVVTLADAILELRNDALCSSLKGVAVC